MSGPSQIGQQRVYPNSHAVLGNQVRMLIASLAKKNFMAAVEELRVIVERSGEPAYFLDNILMNVLSTIAPTTPLDSSSVNYLKFELLSQDSLFEYTPQDIHLVKGIKELIESVADSNRQELLDQLAAL